MEYICVQKRNLPRVSTKIFASASADRGLVFSIASSGGQERWPMSRIMVNQKEEGREAHINAKSPTTHPTEAHIPKELQHSTMTSDFRSLCLGPMDMPRPSLGTGGSYVSDG